MKISYPNEAIELLIKLFQGELQYAKILAGAGFPELPLIYDAVCGNDSIIPFLKSKNHFIIASFLSSALMQDKRAFDFLMAQKAPHWAAAANLVNKDLKAKLWLQKNNFQTYVELAEIMRKKLDELDGTGFEFLYKGPFS